MGLTKAMRGPGLLNFGMAGLMAGAVAFATFAMPAPLFETLVERSGLPNMLAFAQPPLGASARLAAMAALALASFLLVWLILRAFDPVAAEEAEPDLLFAPPRLRRADAHPDAPSRRPLIANVELGEPERDPLLHKKPALPEAPAPDLPAFLVPQPDEDPLELEELAEETEEGAEESLPEEEPAAVVAEIAPEPVVQAEPVTPDPDTIETLAARLPDAGDSNQSIGDLMGRLENGLARRALEQAEAPEPAPEPDPAPQPAAVDDRLRSALNDLQKMAGRGAA